MKKQQTISQAIKQIKKELKEVKTRLGQEGPSLEIDQRLTYLVRKIDQVLKSNNQLLKIKTMYYIKKYAQLLGNPQ
jgi:hypothetical protein